MLRLMSDQFAMEWPEFVTVVVSALGIYLTFVVLVRVLGARSLAGLSIFDVASIVAMGAIIGRTAIGFEPTLITGIVAMASLFFAQGAFGALRAIPALNRVLNRRAVALVKDGVRVPGTMQRLHVSEDELRQAARSAGLQRLEDAAYVVLEPTGSINVIRSGQDIDPWLVADIRRR